MMKGQSVNALGWATPISTANKEVLAKMAKGVNALGWATPISTKVMPKEYQVQNTCQCPRMGYSYFYRNSNRDNFI